MKILFAIYALNNGGAERALVNLLTEMDPEKYDIDLLLFTKEGMFLSQVPPYVNIIDNPDILEDLYAANHRKSLKTALRFAYKIYATVLSRLTEKKYNYQNANRWIKHYSKHVPKLDKKYDTAVAFISGDVLFYINDKVEADKKIVFVHNDYRAAEHAKTYEKDYFKAMDAIVTISDTCADVLKEEFPEFKDKILYLPNIVSSEVIRKRAGETIPEELNSESRPKILSIGRLSEQKGFDLAVSAASIMKSRNINFKWYIMGSGELENDLKKQIEELNVADCVELLGSKENPYAYMKNCDIMAQTSRWEGKSVVLDEAKIIGMPILATNYPTAKDQIKDKVEGVITDMNPEAIAKGLEELLNNEEKRLSISDYLKANDYGNACDIEKYYRVFD